LIVEDNAINPLVTRGMLLKPGYQVRTADNGTEALEVLRSETRLLSSMRHSASAPALVAQISVSAIRVLRVLATSSQPSFLAEIPLCANSES
jgi:CheY-like chemotaxis protein